MTQPTGRSVDRRSALRWLGGVTAVAAATTTTAMVLGAGQAAAAGTDLQPISFIDTRVGGILDGTTDNGPSGTNALAKAVGILNAQGGEIFIPPGVAKFASRPGALPSNAGEHSPSVGLGAGGGSRAAQVGHDHRGSRRCGRRQRALVRT